VHFLGLDHLPREFLQTDSLAFDVAVLNRLLETELAGVVRYTHDLLTFPPLPDWIKFHTARQAVSYGMGAPRIRTGSECPYSGTFGWAPGFYSRPDGRKGLPIDAKRDHYRVELWRANIPLNTWGNGRLKKPRRAIYSICHDERGPLLGRNLTTAQFPKCVSQYNRRPER
jgi:hypothetical protein